MITIAVSKGYLFQESLNLFKKIGILFDDDLETSRKLFSTDRSKTFRLLMIRPWDVPTYVENGSADLGIVGHDVLQEQQSGLTRLLDLKFGACKLVLAGLHKTQPDALSHNTVIATKYPTCTERYFQGKGIKVNILKLYGAIELAPLAGLSDIICDLTATGKSLKENNLYIIDTLFQSTATLVSNPTSLKIHYNTLTTLCKQLIQA